MYIDSYKKYILYFIRDIFCITKDIIIRKELVLSEISAASVDRIIDNLY